MKVLIFGTGSFAKVVTYYVKKYTDWKIQAYVIDKEYKAEDSFLELPLLDTQTAISYYSPRKYAVILAMGYREMNRHREDKYHFFKKAGYVLPNLVHPSVVDEGCRMGEGNILLEKVSVGPFCGIGNSNIIWNGCTISHETVLGDFNYLAPGVTMAGCVNVGNNCFLGTGAVVRSAREISDYTLIGAGCYINHDTEEKRVYVPARSVCLEGKTCFDMHL